MPGTINLAKNPGPRADPTINILLSGHCIKLTFKYASLSPQVSSEVPGPHQRSFFVEWRAAYEETHDWPKCRDYVFLEG